ncbi:MAG: methyltransferase [Desulfobacterales bacterium]|jgi:tRNA1Val (adenine37-N6)-methyltransferase|nr:methyltransferase [Desulfobacterales bacterium]
MEPCTSLEKTSRCAALDAEAKEPPTTDTFFGGRVALRQHRRGYRFSIDAVILAGSLHPQPGDSLVDLGTGCGIVPILLCFRQPRVRIWGVEVQASLAGLAVENVRANAMDGQVRILNADLRDVGSDDVGGPVDWVVSNPPYRRGRSGRVNPDAQRAIARHEIAMTLPDLIAAARRLLKTGGRFAAVYAAERIADLLFHMRSAHIEPKRLRSVHSNRQSDARLILVEGVKGGRPGAIVAPPLILYDDDGSCSEAIRALTAP